MEKFDVLHGVRWGSASSAYQIEGATDEEGRSPSIWDEFVTRPGAIARGEDARTAVDAYHHPERSVDAAQWLGLETYRLSVSWSRLVPDATRTPNPAGVAYYRGVLAELRARGIEPAVTLYHWDLPQWLQERGGWTSLDTAAEFVAYAQIAVRELGDLARDWFTINEPFCAAFHGHLSGQHAPGIRDEPTALRAALVQLHAHGEAVRAMRLLNPEARIGLAINLADLEPASSSPDDLAALERADLVENRLFLHTLLDGRLPEDTVPYFGEHAVAAAVEGLDLPGVAEPLDFIGVNYYEHNVVRSAPLGNDPIVRGVDKLPVPEPRSANGVAVHPEGFTRVLLRVAAIAPDLPIWVTENGIGLADALASDGRCVDTARVAFLERYLAALADAVAQGARVEAYYFWALMDNFEWAHGYALRYGLFFTDFATGTLTPKASAERYRDFIALQSTVDPVLHT